MTDHYETLGLPRDATEADIRKAYRKAAAKHHPDREKGDAENMQRVNNARDVLMDAARRAKYDATGDDGEDKTEAAAVETLILFVKMAIENAPETSDIISVAHALMTQRIDTMIRLSKDAQSTIARAKRRAAKVRAKGARDLIGQIFESQIKSAQHNEATALEAIQVLLRARDMLADYETIMGAEPKKDPAPRIEFRWK